MSWSLQLGGKIYGDAETVAGLRQTRVTLGERVKAVLFASAKELQSAIKAEAPYRGGVLRHSIRISRRAGANGPKAMVYIAKPGFYGRFLEYGVDKDVMQLARGTRARLAQNARSLGLAPRRRMTHAQRIAETYRRHLAFAPRRFFSGPYEALADRHEAAISEAVRDAVEGRS